MSVDRLDHRIIELFTREPGTSIVQAAKRLGVARPTVQARLARLRATGVVTGIVPRLEPAAFGYGVMALVRVLIDQREGRAETMARLEALPEVIDLFTVTGDVDLSLRVAARSNEDLQRILDEIGQIPSVTRTTSSIVLRSHFHGRALPLLAKAAGDAGASGGADGDAAGSASAGSATGPHGR